MTFIKVAAGVVNQTPMDWESNRQHIIAAIEQAKQENTGILCLPELCISGYGCEDYFFAEDLPVQAMNSLLEILPHCDGIMVSVGLPVKFNNRLYNAACLIVNQQIAGFYCKQFLANNGIHYEARWFHAWPASLVEKIEINKKSYPIGDVLFDISGNKDDSSGGIKVAFEICEDAWVADRPGRRHYERGADIILNPSASHFAFHKFQTREQLVVDASRAFGCSYVYTNLLGNEAGQAIYDGDAMIASNGNLLVSGPRFSYADYFIFTAVIDISEARLSQVQNRSRIVPDGNWKVPVYFPISEAAPVPFQTAAMEPFEKGGYLKEEEFARAVALGLFDYLRKSRSKGFTISLSGGADSCACTALASLMIRLADESIGLDNFKKKLNYITDIQELKSEEEIAAVLIHTIYQGTQNSSSDTLASARDLAGSVHAAFYQIDINGLVETYTGLIEGVIERELTWEKDDIALQNIQARVRAPGVWLLTNLAGHLLLATSNRSEVAVGYATMDGDTAGSISPIAGIDKNWLRQWLVWLEQTGCEVKGRHIRVEGLQKMNSLQPTAELRPQERRQTDEEDLMPYDFLDSLERWAIKDKKSPVDCFRYLVVHYAGKYTQEQTAQWVDRFFRLWSRNQWKRERYAPSFHLDDYNLNPRTWCRFPILSGGFEKELDELKHFAGTNRRESTRKRIGF